ncbi:hypothetical protein HOY80DRAFT_882828, partial [Tuber brumale]
ARVTNNSVTRTETTPAPFYGANGQLIPDFQRTVGEANRLTSKSLYTATISRGTWKRGQ